MPRIELAPEVLDDFDRILEHLEQYDVENRQDRVDGIVAAFDVLERSPEVGRPVGDGLRELVIGRGAKGYVALYRFVSRLDTVFVLAVRAQRESDFDR